MVVAELVEAHTPQFHQQAIPDFAEISCVNTPLGGDPSTHQPLNQPLLNPTADT
jgi:hypothetical protein